MTSLLLAVSWRERWSLAPVLGLNLPEALGPEPTGSEPSDGRKRLNVRHAARQKG